jgi:hypothetical protein
MIVYNRENWLEEYRKDKSKIWVWVYLYDGSDFGFNEYTDWYEVIEKLKDTKKSVSKIVLQYKSTTHEFPLNGFDGVYFVRSVLGEIGQDAVHTLTIGGISEDKVFKTIFLKDGLIKRYTEISKINECFEKAMIIWKQSQ